MHAGRPHVLQIFQPDKGGVPAYVANLGAGLRDLGWRVSVAAPRAHTAAARLARVADGRLMIDSASAWSPRADARALRTLATFARCEGVDLIHGHSSKASMLSAIAARRVGCPSVYTPHTWAFQRDGGPLAGAPFAAVEAMLARRFHRAIITVSAAEAQAAQRWRVTRPGQVCVVPSGLPDAGPRPTREGARRLLGLAGAPPVVAWLARLHRAKRPEDLAGLAARLGRRARVVALGEGLPGSPAGHVLERAGGCVLRDGDPRVLLAAADVLVLTSAWESLPFCVLEAMQAALPVVAYDVGDLSAQVADSGSGFLVRPFDLDEMARRIGLLVEHPALRVALGEAGNRRLAERFSYAAMVAAVDGVYREALALPLAAASSAPVTSPAPVPTGRLVEVTP